MFEHLGILALGYSVAMGVLQPPPVYRMTIDCPGTTTFLAEATVAIPIEVHLGGLPGCTDMVSYVQPGRVDVDLYFERGSWIDYLNQRLAWLDLDSLPADAQVSPIIVLQSRKVVRGNRLGEHPEVPMEFVVVTWKSEVIAEAKIDETAFRKTVMSALRPDETDEQRSESADERADRLRKVMIPAGSEQIELPKLAEVKIVNEPATIVRRYGRRLTQVKEPTWYGPKPQDVRAAAAGIEPAK